MNTEKPARRWSWAVLALLLVAWATILTLAPAEATIGTGIRIVYVHVALIWAGLAGLLLNGLLGLVVLLAGSPRGRAWMALVGWVSLALFAAGVGTSLIAEQVNWGGIAWSEPRTAANLNLLALATILQVFGSWLRGPRPAGLVYIILAGAALWITATTELQLHPAGAVAASGSGAIRATFYALAGLSLLVGAWLVWFFRPATARRRKSPI
jgi:hypothetical protein